MNYEIVTLDEKKVAGLKTRTTNANGKSMEDVGKLWNKFIGENLFMQVTDAVDTKAIGLYTEYEGDVTKPYTFMCGTEVSKANENFENMIIPSGKYAKFTVKGDMIKAVAKAWQDIWEMDLDRKYLADFEHYHNDSEDMSNQTIDIYISIN